MSDDWRDGFLFVGNQLSLDFLNTRPVLNGEPAELLPDAPSLLRWLSAAGLISVAKAEALRTAWTDEADGDLEKLREFREHLREATFALESGEIPSPGFVARLNALLAEYPRRVRVIEDGKNLAMGVLFDPHGPADVLAVIAYEAAQLVCAPEHERLRKCDNCVLHFLDTSKKGLRRWCSMKLCGNRNKVAAYVRRKRELGREQPSGQSDFPVNHPKNRQGVTRG